MKLTSLEICGGAGGQALGLERAGFEHLAVVELDPHACVTLKLNRPVWEVLEEDVHTIHAHQYLGLDLFAGGVPCPPFSVAGKQLGFLDDRDLFPQALRLIGECKPRAIMLENVRGFLNPKFENYRNNIQKQLEEWGYKVFWRLLNASDYGVPQLRPRTLLVALKEPYASDFKWPEPRRTKKTVGGVLLKEMASRGWPGAKEWGRNAARIAPTLVGGSKKHGGPDLGPSRAKKAWAELGVNGGGVADSPPGAGFEGMPKLTVSMTARLQGFPATWKIAGKKTNAYRQVGNAFPPPVAQAVGEAIVAALNSQDTTPNKPAEQVQTI